MGDYPGAEYKMSLYGLKERNPEENAGQWKERIKGETRIHNNHLAIRGNGTSIWPGLAPKNTTPISYFDDIKKNDNSQSQYDRLFHAQCGYNSRLHRDDRQHTVGLDMLAEERARVVPTRSSSEYGRRVHTPLEDSTARPHVRIDKVMKGFYRSNGTSIPTTNSRREPVLPEH